MKHLIIPIVDAVAAEFGVTRALIMARNRHPSVVAARHESILRACEAYPNKSDREIAALFNLDRTTIQHARHKAAQRRMETR